MQVRILAVACRFRISGFTLARARARDIHAGHLNPMIIDTYTRGCINCLNYGVVWVESGARTHTTCNDMLRYIAYDRSFHRLVRVDNY